VRTHAVHVCSACTTAVRRAHFNHMVEPCVQCMHAVRVQGHPAAGHGMQVWPLHVAAVPPSAAPARAQSGAPACGASSLDEAMARESMVYPMGWLLSRERIGVYAAEAIALRKRNL
jgi:hypothetical protein